MSHAAVTLGVLVLALVTFIAVIVVTGSLCGLSRRMGLLDIPNRRSSHVTPVPRGGGVGFGLVLAGLVLLGSVLGFQDREVMIFLSVWILATLLLGWVDDRHGLAPVTRLAFQLALAGSVVIVSGPLVEPLVPGAFFEHTAVRIMVTVVWFMWLLNLYNFMDGIDGIASVQAIVAAAVMAAWFAAVGDTSLAMIGLSVVASSAGFLVWNRSPAKLFMGDSGSTVLGLVLAWMAYAGVNRHGIPVLAFVLLLGVFIGDATVTLVRRLFRGEAITQAHRSHFYQRAVALGASHNQVTGLAGSFAILLSLLATLHWRVGEMHGLWVGLALVILTAVMAAITLRERRLRKIKHQ